MVVGTRVAVTHNRYLHDTRDHRKEYIVLIKFQLNYICGREDEDKRMVKPQKYLFWHILKDSTHSLYGAWSFILVHIWFTLSEGPKGFVKRFFKKLEHGS